MRAGLGSFFALSVFVAAALLFFIEPLIAKMLLPLLGGAPAVWNTCMVFFQGGLLLGYAYAHVAPRVLGVRAHAVVHAAVLFLPLIVLPFAIDSSTVASWPNDRTPVFRLLALLVGVAGAPFAVTAASSPLLQRWFAHARPNEDPYPLYAASNLGSMLALAAYPFAVEPFLTVRAQGRAWMIGYVAMIGLLIACAASAARGRPPAEAQRSSAPISARRRARWFLLALVPSSLLLGVTNHVTTDIAAIPLFWVAPLAVYLGTFILVFAARPPLAHAAMVRLFPLAATFAVGAMLVEIAEPAWLLIAMHMAMLFFACMVAHGELARDRPEPARLTEYYLWIGLGGVAGGALNALVAPLVLRALAEYPLMIVCALLLRRPASPDLGFRRADVLVGAAIGGAVVALALAVRAADVRANGVAVAIVFGIPLLAAYTTLQRPVRFALSTAGILLGSLLWSGGAGRTIARERNFFGVIRVTRDRGGRFFQIVHGNTIHGQQSVDPAKRREPLGYYHRTGPLGDVFDAFRSAPATKRVSVIGLGAGAMAAYARDGEAWTYYEINPAVVRVAEDPRYFTYLADAFPAHDCAIVLGDARLRLREAEDASIGLLVLDAFSSDAIPAHLLTREAFVLYLRKLAPGGLLGVHVSNRYLDLKPVILALADDAGVLPFFRDDLDVPPELAEAGKSASQWIVLARTMDALAWTNERRGWTRLTGRKAALWTDDFSNLMSVFRW